jgi:hypothetical protein
LQFSAVLLAPRRGAVNFSRRSAASAAGQRHGRTPTTALHAFFVNRDLAAAAAASDAGPPTLSLAAKAAAAAHNLGASAQSLGCAAADAAGQCGSAAAAVGSSVGHGVGAAAAAAADGAGLVGSAAAAGIGVACKGAAVAAVAAANVAQRTGSAVGSAVGSVVGAAPGCAEAALGASGSFLLGVYRKQVSLEGLVLVAASSAQAVAIFLAVRVAHNIEYDMVSHWETMGFRSFCSSYYA